jgi:cytoskeletal protein RodZ
MSGRHRNRSRSWRLPVGVGALAALGLVALVWLTAAVPGGGQVSAADRLALSAPQPASSASLSGAPVPSSATPSSPTQATPSTTPSTPVSSMSAASPKPATKKPDPKTKPKPPPAATNTVSAGKACSSTLAGAQPNAAQVGNHILTKFKVGSVGGRAGRAGTSDHPTGLALDFMVDTTTGNALAAYVLAHQGEFGVTYVIWRQRINTGSGWDPMEDRGSPTANHFDHVHVSFKAGAKVSVTC